MIESIEIEITKGSVKNINSIIIPKENMYYKNNKKYRIEDKTIEKLLEILTLWKYEYGSSSNIDEEEFRIIVREENKETIYHGKGIFPSSYPLFLDIVRGLENGK